MENIVKMTAEEMKEYEAYKKAQAAKAAKKQRKENLETYTKMVDEQVSITIPELQSLAEQLSLVKSAIFENFQSLLDMKKDVLKMTSNGQRSHTFTSSDGKMRIELGVYQLDNYLDTVNDGIAMVKEYITSLAESKETRALVDMVLKLLSKDQKGNLKASRVLQLRQIAEEVNNERFTEGVEIIMNSYAPTPSKTFIRAFVKDDKGEWKGIPLSITDAE
ncbi:MAG: DUF3164 family protein [Bacteroidales bacterium]|nr:DUF3164 family protein [Bacteroidales bacterium]